MTRLRCDQTPAWAALHTHFDKSGRQFDLRDAFAQDAGRFAAFSQDAPHVFADLSKNLIDAPTEALLLTLARQCSLESQRDAMFAGEQVNASEHRAVKHFLLRNPPLAQKERAQLAINSIASEALEALDVQRTLDAVLAFAEQVRADESITDIVSIGIGGSDLGPQMAVMALNEFAIASKRFHFVASVDGDELAGALKGLRPGSTLFLVASKTFTTLETMTNAQSAKRWFEAQGGQDMDSHFVALTSNVAAAKEFGISTTFGFWDWVGGRYSLWSVVGLPIAIAIGAAGFRDFLAGAHAMDQHFCSTPLERNLPVRLGLLDAWYRNFHRFSSRSIAPYSSALKRWPAYLQQLEMESNGKRVDATGQLLTYDTAPVIWGEPGTNGQHAYFQMLHQGTSVVPVEFVAFKQAAPAQIDVTGHHTRLLANALAQAQALMSGQSDAGGHKDFPGNRPSTFLLLEALTPASLGAVIALQEHRVFVSGAIWGINSFDQWGVELGKVLAKDIETRLASGDTQGLNASTAGLIARLMA